MKINWFNLWQGYWTLMMIVNLLLVFALTIKGNYIWAGTCVVMFLTCFQMVLISGLVVEVEKLIKRSEE